MKVTSLSIKNFLSHRESSLRLNDLGVVLIEGENRDRGGSNGAGKCLPSSTPLLDPQSGEYLPIERFVREQRPCVAGVVGGRCVRVPVTDWLSLGTKPLVRLALSSGVEFDCATTHPILTPAGCVQAQNLRTGDWVAEIGNVDCVPGCASQAEQDLALLLGLLIGDGSFTDHGVKFTKTDAEITEHFRSLVTRSFPECLVRSVRAKEHRIVWARRRKAPTPPVAWLKSLGLYGKDGNSKFLPPAMLGGPKNLVASLVAGLWTTDGYVSSTTDEVSYSSGSKRLAQDVRRALIRLNVRSRIRTRHVMGSTYWEVVLFTQSALIFHSQVRLLGRKQRLLDALVTRLRATPRNPNCDLIPPYFNADLPTKSKSGKRRTREQLGRCAFSRAAYLDFGGDPAIANSDLHWVQIEAVAEAGVAECYDITVDTDEHLYVADTLVTHNSAVLEALYWCLYGVLLRPIKLADLSHNGEGNVSVQADLALTDGTLVTVRRTHSFKGEPPITFTINGVGVECGTVAETQKRINALVRADAKTFKHVVLFSAATESFASLTDKGQKEILDAILGLDRLPKAQERTNEKLKDFKIARLNADTAVQNCQTETLRSQERIRKLEEAEQGFAHQRQIAVKQAKAVLIQLMKAEPDLVGDESNRLEEKRGRLELLKGSLGPSTGGAVDISGLVAAKQERTKLHMRLAQAQRSLSNIRLTDPDALVAEKSACPTCAQALPVSALKALHATYVARLEEEKEDQAHYQRQIRLLQESLERVEVQVKELEDAYNERGAALAEVQTLSVEIVRLEAQANARLVEHQRWCQQLKQAEAKLEHEKAQKSPYGALLEAERVEAAKTAARLFKLQLEQAKLDEDQRYLDFWRLGFGNQGVKGLILDTVTPYLNEQANHYAKILTAGAAKIEFMTHFRSPDSGDVKEKFDVDAGFTHGASTYDGVSDGERRLLDLACLFALGDLAAARSGSPLQLRLLDEPFGPLDTVGQERVLKVLNLLAERLGTVLVTSHEQHVQAIIEKRIIVTKSNGVSRVEQEV